MTRGGLSIDLAGVTVRTITAPNELGLFSQLPYVLNEELTGDLADGHRRPEWMRVALRGDRLLATAAWWSRPGAGEPGLLDVLDIENAPRSPWRSGPADSAFTKP